MKKILIALLIALSIVAIPASSQAKSHDSGYTKAVKYAKKKYTSKKKYKNWKIKVVDSSKLTEKMLLRRKRNHIIYIECFTGTADGKGWGTGNNEDILYRGHIKTKKGDVVKSYFVYRPTKYIDDCDRIADVIIKKTTAKPSKTRTVIGVVTDTGKTCKVMTVDDNQVWNINGDYGIGDILKLQFSDNGTPSNYKDDKITARPIYIGYVDGEADLQDSNKLYAFWLGDGYWERADGINWTYTEIK